MGSDVNKHFIKLLTAIALPALLLWGCHMFQKTEPPKYQVVTSITVTYQNGKLNTWRHYNNTAKMHKILNYLRRIDPYGTPDEDPEPAPGSDFHIILSLSDGSHTVYRQKADRFMQESGGKWKKIDPFKAEELSRILGKMQSDIAQTQ